MQDRRFIADSSRDWLHLPAAVVQPVLAREGEPSVDIAKVAEIAGTSARFLDTVCIHSPAQWKELIENLPDNVDAIMPVSSPCYPTEIWNECPEPLVKRGLPVLFWPLIAFDEPDFWKWSACDFLRALKIETWLIENNRTGVVLLRALAMKRYLKNATLTVFGKQNFPWNASSGGHLIRENLGTRISVRPLSDFRERAAASPATEIRELAARLGSRYELAGVHDDELTKALRIYAGIRSVLDEERSLGFGVNCYGELIVDGGRDVPCLAQALAREDGFISSCDGDYCAMMNMAMASFFWETPCMMSNLYPLEYEGALTGHFGDSLRANSIYDRYKGNLARMGHCGFVGVVPSEMAPDGKAKLKDWGGTYEIKRDGSGCGIDCDLAPGMPFTGIELHFNGKDMTIATGEVLETTRHPGMPHCESTALLRFDDLKSFVAKISREHMVLVPGDRIEDLKILCTVLGLHIL